MLAGRASRGPRPATCARLLGPAVALLFSACDATLPPLPEIVMEVDTDLPVPLAASKLRVDLFSDRGGWFESADVARPDPRDWPVSFSVYSDDPSAPGGVWIRLRAYLDGHTRDVRSGEGPRLIENGRDVTPLREPDPRMAVDRLVFVEMVPDEKIVARVVLRGACVGSPASLDRTASAPLLGEATSCVDAARPEAFVEPLPRGDRSLGALASVEGSWLGAPPCPERPELVEDRACVRGGATVVGTRDLLSSIELAARPVRIFGLRRFFLDREEVSVARFRAALAEGLVTTAPLENEGPLGPTAPASCTWSRAPRDREEYALNCVGWETARAFCRYVGGDLPTEAQWEHAATVAGHGKKVAFPWGNDEPDCDRAAFGRVDVGTPAARCLEKGPNPPAPADSARDRSPLGLLALAGGLSEWMLDEAAPYDAPCWENAALVDPVCAPSGAEHAARSVRGANYVLPEMVHATTRFSDAGGPAAPLGFRCAYTSP